VGAACPLLHFDEVIIVEQSTGITCPQGMVDWHDTPVAKNFVCSEFYRLPSMQHISRIMHAWDIREHNEQSM
jgi:hypothetical protein